MGDGTKRIELIVLDLVERCGLPQDIRIKRNGNTLYSGSVRRTPKELLNEPVIRIYSTQYYNYLGVEIE